MAQLLFQDAIDYQKVYIYNRHFFFLKNNHTAMAPLGSIYFPLGCYEQDFSLANDRKKEWFIHELTHVWQYQMGYNVVWAAFRLFLQKGYQHTKRGQAAYQIDFSKYERTQFTQFNMEQQAQIVCQYFAAVYLKQAAYQNKIPFLAPILVTFLKQPNNKSLVPLYYRIDGDI
ncbi:type IV secretion protein Rhs [Neisseria sp. Ec49-e6-T10]|uniref:type IV secretion protein Rhs n=1 Tax=Neisseria sp. Ec49-e6-T10 TaxID=3140744 RepID=UPI003EB8AE6F